MTELEIGRRLRELREEKGWSLDELAQRLADEQGEVFTPQALGHYERGARPIKVKLLPKWAAVLGAEFTATFESTTDEAA